MEYRTLGRTGVRVSTYALGTMMFGADGNPDEKECIEIVHAALDAGVNLIDTADTYSHGEAEDIVGKAIAGHRDEIVLSSKVRLRAGDGPNEQGASRLWIMRQVEASLKRLKTDRIDILFLHRFDALTPIDEKQPLPKDAPIRCIRIVDTLSLEEVLLSDAYAIEIEQRADLNALSLATEMA